MSTVEWTLPKIEGVHIVARHGDAYAFQFPSGGEEEVLAHLRGWMDELESGLHQTALSDEQPPPPLPKVGGRRQAAPAFHPRTLTHTLQGNTAQTPTTEPGARRTLAESEALALGESPRPAAARATITRPALQARTALRTSRVLPPQTGKKLTQEQIDAWNKQQQEGMAIFQELKRTKKPEDKAVTPDEISLVLKARMEARGEVYLNEPGEEPAVLEAEVEEEWVESPEAQAVSVPKIPVARVESGPEVSPMARAEAVAMSDSPETTQAVKSGPAGPSPTQEVLTPNRVPLMTAERKWNAQVEEWQNILRELKSKFAGVTITRAMVDTEQEKRAALRGEALIKIVAPGDKGQLIEAASVTVDPTPAVPAAAAVATQSDAQPSLPLANVLTGEALSQNAAQVNGGSARGHS